ncbi:MAG TPA: DNA cytosine methyltransferase [Candidatus Sulfotelmatobacter sp.]|nr:DNA cytosine methyltransferase [Candidatus Sulfotelmatobacter sp.]
MPSYYEFFAGGGMARAGLGDGWECLFANDIDAKKGASYAANWGSERLKIEDVGELATVEVPGCADLAWASFPCQDLSLAGDYVGLRGERSGTFWLFWRLMKALAKEARAPSVIVLENVCGALTSHGGKDFAAIGSALADGGYRFGAVVMDAVRFVPQSRPRLFIVAVREDQTISRDLTQTEPDPLWHPAHLVGAYGKLPPRLKKDWVWWRLPAPPARIATFGDIVDDDPEGVEWHTPAETRRLLSLMSAINLQKVERAKRMRRRIVGGVYKRTRVDDEGKRVQRAEIRFDDVSGCLRTPVGGSSRQSIVIVEGNKVRSRLLAPREAARLMGLPESYKLPEKYNEAYHLVGDGVVVPVVRFLAENILESLLAGETACGKEAA